MKQKINPAGKNLAVQICSAVEQFNSVNPDHKLPNVLVIVNHAIGKDRANLHTLLAGVPMPDGSKVPVFKPGRQMEVWEKARRIDLFFWIDAGNGTCEHAKPAGALRLAAACALFGIDPNT